jgi:LuxR family maltose regulon positive regulatory protein
MGRAADAAAAVDGHAGEAIALVRAHLALSDQDAGAALSALEGVQSGAASVEAPALEALAHRLRGEHEAALEHIECALEVAERTGHRLALELAGTDVEELLVARIRAGTAFRALAGQALGHLRDARFAGVAGDDGMLTRREREILAYLPTTLRNQEIADELEVSTNTVKTHLRCLYRKLDADGRRDAVKRARELHLIRAA